MLNQCNKLSITSLSHITNYVEYLNTCILGDSTVLLSEKSKDTGHGEVGEQPS